VKLFSVSQNAHCDTEVEKVILYGKTTRIILLQLCYNGKANHMQKCSREIFVRQLSVDSLLLMKSILKISKSSVAQRR
jgi:hypothetical protein